MRFLVRFRAETDPPEKLLSCIRTVAQTLGVDPRNPKWTSYGALELDIFSATKADFDLFLETVRPIASIEFAKDLNLVQPYKPEPELIAEARHLFNDERYWECHEVLEGVWRTKQGEEKSLLQGIILVCAAFVHHQKGEEAVARGVLGRAIKQLSFPEREYGGFDIPMLRQAVADIIKSGEFANFRV